MNDIYALLAKGGLSLERLISLCRVVDAGGLSKAAGGDVSRLSLYSRQIKDLESFLGVALTRKVGRTVILTDTARSLAAATRAHLKTLQAFVGKADQSVPFVVGGGHSLLEWHVLPRIPAMHRLLGAGRPIRLLSMRSHDVSGMLQDHRLDLGVVRADAVAQGLAIHPLFRLGYALYASKKLAGRQQPQALLGTAPLAISMGGEARSQFEAAAKKHGVALRIELEVSSFSLAAAAVREGAYAAILPDIVPAGALGADVARLELPLRLGYSRQIVACWHRSAGEHGAMTVSRMLAGNG